MAKKRAEKGGVDFIQLKEHMAEKGFSTISEGDSNSWYFTSGDYDDYSRQSRDWAIHLNIIWDPAGNLISAETNGKVGTIVDLFPGDDCLYGLKGCITSTYPSTYPSIDYPSTYPTVKPIIINDVKSLSAAMLYQALKEKVPEHKLLNLLDALNGPDHGEHGVSPSLPGGSDATSVLGGTSEGPDHSGHGI